MRVYVAGSSGELERAEAAIEQLRAAGATITHDWTADIRAARAAGCSCDADLSDGRALALAISDLEAVATANAVLFLAPTTPTRGAWVEMGYAFGVGKTVIVAGPAARSCIFAHAAECMVASDEAGVATVLEVLR